MYDDLQPSWLGVSNMNDEQVFVEIYASMSTDDFPVCDVILASKEMSHPLYEVKRVHKHDYTALTYRKLYRESKKRWGDDEDSVVVSGPSYFDVITTIKYDDDADSSRDSS